MECYLIIVVASTKTSETTSTCHVSSGSSHVLPLLQLVLELEQRLARVLKLLLRNLLRMQARHSRERQTVLLTQLLLHLSEFVALLFDVFDERDFAITQRQQTLVELVLAIMELQDEEF